MTSSSFPDIIRAPSASGHHRYAFHRHRLPLAACFVAVNVLTAFAIVAMAIAIGAWSLDLVQDRGASRVAGMVGCVSAALTVAILVNGGPSLKPHTLIAVLCAQGVWYVWIAVPLAQRRA